MPPVSKPKGRPDLLTVAEAVVASGLSARSLLRWRTERRGGPRYIRYCSRIFYLRSDLTKWLKRQEKNK